MAPSVVLHEPGLAPFLPFLRACDMARVARVDRTAARAARALWGQWAATAPRMLSLYRGARNYMRRPGTATTNLFLRALRARSDRLAALHEVDAAACWSAHVCFPLDDDEPLFEAAAHAGRARLSARLLAQTSTSHLAQCPRCTVCPSLHPLPCFSRVVPGSTPRDQEATREQPGKTSVSPALQQALGYI